MKMNVKFTLSCLLLGAQMIGADALPQPCTSTTSHIEQINTFTTRYAHLKRVLVNGVETKSYESIIMYVPASGGSFSITSLAEAVITNEISLNGTQIDSLYLSPVGSHTFFLNVGAK